MDDEIGDLMVEVHADTAAFKAEMEGLRTTLDTTLLSGFAQAGNVLERGLLGAVRKGALGFDELKRVALQTLSEIAAQALQSGLGNLFGGPAGGGAGGLLGGALGALLGLPGRATGGPVSPNAPFLVGERGPEVFVPTAAGRVLPDVGSAGTPRDVRVSINVAAPRGTAAPAALQRSARQIASALRREL